jgi:hypothetical protein
MAKNTKLFISISYYIIYITILEYAIHNRLKLSLKSMFSCDKY